jgi:hypothetical protein
MPSSSYETRNDTRKSRGSEAEVYRLGEADLAFAELLPEKPHWLEQEEYEERTSIGFHLGRLTKSVGALVPCEAALLNASQHEGSAG